MRRASAGSVVILAALVSGCGGAGPGPSGTTDLTPEVAHWVAAERLPPAAVPGAKLYAAAGTGCMACHVYLDSGQSNLGAPAMTSEGLLHRGVEWQIKHLRCPTCLVPGSAMPKYESLGNAQLRYLAAFLEASKGER